jgi:hypothetical protein
MSASELPPQARVTITNMDASGASETIEIVWESGSGVPSTEQIASLVTALRPTRAATESE